MKKEYLKPEIEYVEFIAREAITDDLMEPGLGDESASDVVWD